MRSKKRVLFISPAFFGYEQTIKKAIEINGLSVDFFDERTSNSSFFKAIFRLNKNLLTFSIKKYYNKIQKQIKKISYDYFFLIKGEVVPENFIVEFKQNNPSAKLIYYTYDSLKNNNRHSRNVLKYFDKCYSFDFDDVKNDERFRLKHLFYSEEFAFNSTSPKHEYEISFIGTLHSNRYHIIKQIFSNFNNSYIFLYSPAKWWFLFNKIFNKKYKQIIYSEISFKKISIKKVASVFASSRSVLDIQRFGQSGLTMRTFEVLASGAVLVTTNQHIKKADFYNENNIVIVDINDIEGSVDNVKDRIENVNTQAIDVSKYYIINWVKEFFDN